jgi:hypothetical protein
VDDFKKGDLVKWRSAAKEHRGTIIGKSMEGLSDDWLQIFSFSEGGEVVHHISYLIKVEVEGE